jgi:DnaJ family protein A protein 2
MPDLYGVLGVGKKASADEIKRAYKKEALVHHPDRGGSKEKFQALQEAFDVLSDDGKRGHYDMTGQVPQGGGEGQGGMPPDMAAMFGSMFGGGGGPMFGGMPFFGGGMGQTNVKAARGPNKMHEIGVGLSDLYKGKTFTLNMKRDILCSGCRGSGGARIESCGACGGRGVRVHAVQMGPMMSMSHEPCGSCSQTGKKILEKCGVCKGRQIIESESNLDVVIEPGMQEGDRITFVGKCSEAPNFDKPGDVILLLRSSTSDSEKWVRSGEILTYTLTISLAESMLGWGRQLEGHPSGRPIHIVWKDGVLRDGEVLRIAGWGMPVRGSSALGDLRIVCRVTVDQGAWSEEQRRVLTTIWSDWKEPEMKGDTVVASRGL